MKIEIENTYLIEYGVDNKFQAYFIKFDLMDDTIENVTKWEEFFSIINDGFPVKITIER